MDSKTIIKVSILAILVAYYLAYTFNYAKYFHKNSFFTGWPKVFHSIMIWLIPFLWIKILKALLRPIPGSHAFKKRWDFSTGMTDGGIGFWGWLGLSNLDLSHDGNDGSGHDSFGAGSISDGDSGGGDGGGDGD